MKFLFVALGGAIGATGRYAISLIPSSIWNSTMQKISLFRDWQNWDMFPRHALIGDLKKRSG